MWNGAYGAAQPFSPAPASVFGASTSLTPLPWNPGNQPGELYLGNYAHAVIAAGYTAAHPGDEVFVNNRSILSILRASPNAQIGSVNPLFLGLRPDIVNLDAREIYEIKPIERLDDALLELSIYRAVFTAANLPLAPGSSFAPGTTGVVPAPGGLLVYGSPWPGVITYTVLRGSPFSIQLPESQSVREPSRGYWRRLSDATGLSGAALLGYLLVSEASRVLFPWRNFIPAL